MSLNRPRLFLYCKVVAILVCFEMIRKSLSITIIIDMLEEVDSDEVIPFNMLFSKCLVELQV